MEPVTLVDDTFRVNKAVRVTKEMKEAAEEGSPVANAAVGDLLPYKDQYGRVIQNVVKVTETYEGARLEHAIRRARRFLRSVKNKPRGAPRHIAKFLAVYHKADPDGFNRDMAGSS